MRKLKQIAHCPEVRTQSSTPAKDVHKNEEGQRYSATVKACVPKKKRKNSRLFSQSMGRDFRTEDRQEVGQSSTRRVIGEERLGPPPQRGGVTKSRTDTAALYRNRNGSLTPAQLPRLVRGCARRVRKGVKRGGGNPSE